MGNIRIEVSQEESISERIKRVRESLKGYTEEKYPVGDMIIDLGYMIDYIKYSFRELDRFEAENHRLKEQLDREIHINRIMKKALEEYANEDNWEYYNLDSSDECLIGEYQNCEFNEVGFELAQQTLKQIEEME